MFFSTPFISVFSVVKFNTHAQAEKIKKRPVAVGRGHETFLWLTVT